jgi:hypothetical protein
MGRGLAMKRHYQSLTRRKAEWLARRWNIADSDLSFEQWVGRMASTHCRPCSCLGCRSKPKHQRNKIADHDHLSLAMEDWDEWEFELESTNRRRRTRADMVASGHWWPIDNDG